MYIHPGLGGEGKFIEINLYEQIRYLYAVEKLSKREVARRLGEHLLARAQSYELTQVLAWLWNTELKRWKKPLFRPWQQASTVSGLYTTI